MKAILIICAAAVLMAGLAGLSQPGLRGAASGIAVSVGRKSYRAASPSLRVALDHAVEVGSPGCNASAFAQVPGALSQFIGRQLITEDGKLAGVSGANDCSGGKPGNEAIGRPFNRWGLVLDRFDWTKKTFSIVKSILDTSIDPATGVSKAVITGGRLRGAIIRSAYDPDMVVYKGMYLVAFECTLENGVRFGVRGTSSCVGRYDPDRRAMDMRQIDVAVTEHRQGSTIYAASVPRLLVFAGKLYLYWSSLTIRQGRLVLSAERGVEMAMGADGFHPKLVGNRPLHAMDSLSVEVWAPQAGTMNDTVVNVFALKPVGRSILVYAALGGSGCGVPSDRSKGCFRLAIVRSATPLAHHAFNDAKALDIPLPSNPQEYTIPVTDPAGGKWLLGHYIRPPSNGFSEKNPVPSPSFWRNRSAGSALVMYPVS